MGNRINILKLDVEGHEFSVLPQIIESGMLDFIDQIILEVHHTTGTIIAGDPEELNESDMMTMLNMMKLLYSKGYQIINYLPNTTLGTFQCSQNKYYTNFDITFAKRK